MNLKRRLERLVGTSGAPVGSPPASGPVTSSPPVSSAVTSSPPESGVVLKATDSGAPSPSAERQEKLAELRRQLDELIGRDRGPERPPPRPEPALRLADLPFVERPLSSGSYWQRVERLSAGHRVGSVMVDAAAAAEPSVLADLALDARVADADPGSWLFIDTETTGLGGAGSLVFLVGLAAIEPSGAVEVEQLLMVEPSDEAALLERLTERVQRASMLVSFNGKAFDRPQLEARLVMSRMPRLPERPHLDLLHVGRRLHKQRLGRCTLKRVESEVLGFDRGDDIDGSEVGPIYSHFLRSADATGLGAVVHHNFLDVVSMVALVGLYGQRTPPLVGEDLAGLARTLRRAGATERAEHMADIACERGGGVEAYRVRAELAKSRGDCSGAVRDFERLCHEADDPSGRLELAKLYEHKLREPARALHWLSLGTNENFGAAERRRERLERKLRRDPTP